MDPDGDNTGKYSVWGCNGTKGKAAFEYEGYVLTAGLFLAKVLKSLSERHWRFRTRLIGIQMPVELVNSHFGIPVSASSVFTFLACLRIVQEPIRLIPDVAGVFIEAKVSLDRIVKFLEAPELRNSIKRQKLNGKELDQSILIRATEISWGIDSSSKSTLRNINVVVKPGEKVAICGEVGSGKSTLFAAVLGEVPKITGVVHVFGKIAYVSQTAWIQTGTIQENILSGAAMEPDYVTGALSGKTVLLVTHQIDFLPAFNSILLNNSAGEIIRSDTSDQLMPTCQEFQDLVNAHKNTAGPDIQVEYASSKRATTSQGEEIQKVHVTDKLIASWRDQLIRQEERETGDTGFKPYMQHLSQERASTSYSLHF
ncbi:hypothetical protein POTOM_000767 [Populus tomentosa]|uniref:ABC transporter domain-containing protein n=1 Tax=Populus tomentosa TaxID=118781 RepID=A0A8X8DGN8_POPTO|nr:hypothetical protein POTOM_000767 [Populus tomentosa]